MIANKSKPLVGVSSCLLGNKVRYDGQEKTNQLIVETMSQYLEFVAICPEVGIGLGVPRAPIQLVGETEHLRVVGVEDPAMDVTDQLIAYAKTIIQDHPNLSGFIFKSRSPSCAVNDAPLFNTTGKQINTSGGLFASTIIQLKPELPVEDEARLEDNISLNAFLHRVMHYANQESVKGL